MSFKTDHLRYFVTVAEEGQITRAARRLYMAQPALSQAMSQLETDLGLQLLERHPRGVRLTASGETFLEKARAVLASEEEVVQTARSLVRAERGVLDVGFIGPPPSLVSPELFSAFGRLHPEAAISFHDLPFPAGPTRSWLESVDIAFCQTPSLDGGIRARPIRIEPRAALLSREHPLAGAGELLVEQVIDETFISYHPSVQPEWAGFHSLDDHREGPPAELTDDRVTTALQMLALFGRSRAVTTLPLADARLIELALPDAVALPIRDARPATISLVWHAEHPLVGALLDAAASLEQA